MQFLEISSIVEFQRELINRFGGLHGIRDKKLLESALAYPQLLHSVGMERDTYILAAAYCYHLINNHPFLDGNKRIGTLAMIIFLKINGIEIQITKNKLYDLAMRTAKAEINESEIAQALKLHIN